MRAAFEAFSDLGAAPRAELARLELQATGETARRRDASALEALTPQELRIAMVLAEGRTTRVAAAELFLSPKTIEYHLRSAIASSASARGTNSPGHWPARAASTLPRRRRAAGRRGV